MHVSLFSSEPKCTCEFGRIFACYHWRHCLTLATPYRLDVADFYYPLSFSALVWVDSLRIYGNSFTVSETGVFQGSTNCWIGAFFGPHSLQKWHWPDEPKSPKQSSALCMCTSFTDLHGVCLFRDQWPWTMWPLGDFTFWLRLSLSLNFDVSPT